MFFSAHMAINCIINYILSQSVSFSGESSSTQRKWGGNDDPPTRPNVFFSHSTCPSSVFLSSAKMQDSLARMTENRGCGCWNPSCAFNSKHRVRCQPTAMHKTTVYKKKIKKTTLQILPFFSVPVSIQSCFKQCTGKWVVSIPHNLPSVFHSILFIKIKHREKKVIN